MNILFTSDLSGIGGGETSLVNLCEELSCNHKVFVLCARNGRLVEILNNKGIETYIMDYRNKRYLLLNVIKIRILIKRLSINIIHNNDPLTSIIMYASSLFLGIKNYWTCHGQWYKFSKIKKYLVKISNRHIFCVSTPVEKSLNSMGIFNTSVTYLGIPLQKYANAMSTSLRVEYNIRNTTILLGCIGRFQPIKGQLKLLRAVNSLISDGVDVCCLFVGGCIFGSEEEAAYYQTVKEYIYKNNLEDKAILLGERDDVPSILQEIDYLVIPSDNESFGMVAVESLASGTPVISTPNDGVSEILCFNNKYLAKSNDSNGLADKIKENISDNTTDIEWIKSQSVKYDITIISRKYQTIFEC